MENSIVYEKSKVFAFRMVRLYEFLIREKREYVMSKQLLRSGTSIGANLAEGICAVSKPDFLNKMYIALKECNETRFWLELLHDTKYLTDTQYESIFADANEIFKILTASTKTIKESLKEKEVENKES